MICACLLTVLLILYIVFDVNYFLRVFFTLAVGRLFEKKKKIFDETTIYGLCTTQDIDIVFKHMNNARYLRELDFARFHYYDGTGIFGAISKRGGGAVQSASCTRYRRPIPIFAPYKVTTKIVYWEDQHFYLEHQFITLTDNFIRTVILSKQSATGLKVPVSEILEELEPNIKRPEMFKDLELWIQSMQESSQKLKKKN